jgi:hypothetical protein
MKKTVVIFGLLSGAVSSLLMLLSVPLLDRIGFDNGAILGYTGMVMAFLLVFFGVRSYRDNVAGGTLGTTAPSPSSDPLVSPATS